MAKKPVAEPDGSVKTVEVPEPIKRKCELKQVLPAGVIQLLASAPHNETVRNVLLAHLKVPVPEELKSYKDIQDWIEFNIEPPSAPLVKGSPPPGRTADLVEVLVDAIEIELGSCNYSRDVSGRGNVGVSREDILDAAINADDEDEFFRLVREGMDDAVRDRIEMEPDDEFRYRDYEVSDSADFSVEIRQTGQEALKLALRDIDPEAYERLFE